MSRNVCERPFFGRNEKLHPIGEEKQPDFVVVADGAEGEQTGDFRREFALRLRRRCRNLPEALTSTTSMTVSSRSSVNFLTKARAQPRGHIPIDRANFVARLIFAHIFEVHPASFEDAVVIAGEGGLDETLGLDFERADFL